MWLLPWQNLTMGPDSRPKVARSSSAGLPVALFPTKGRLPVAFPYCEPAIFISHKHRPWPRGSCSVHGRPRYAMRPKALEFHTGLLVGKPGISRFLRNNSHPSPLRHYVPAHRHPYLVARPLVAHSSLRVLRIHHRIPSPGSLRYR